MTTTIPTAYKIGDKVHVHPDFDPNGRFHGVVFTVAKLPVGRNGKNYTCTRDGGGQGLRAAADQMIPAGTTPVLTPRPTEPIVYFNAGQVVRVVPETTGDRRVPAGELFVVQRDQGGATVSIVRLGGHPEGRYWRLARRALICVPVAEIAERMPAHLEAIAP